MQKRAFLLSLVVCLFAVPVYAQQKTISGKVTSEQGTPLAGVSVVIKGTRTGTTTSTEGNYSIRASTGQVLQYRFIGTAPAERTVAEADVINIQLHRVAMSLDAIVVSALGQTTELRSIGTAQQTVQGADIAQTQRENFINSLQGRIAGVEVTSSSGGRGAPPQVPIRGVSSTSISNQPPLVVDGLPIDNK